MDNADFLANTFVLPMRLEFKVKVKKPAYLNAEQWTVLASGGFKNFSFNVVTGGSVIPWMIPARASADKFFYKRVSAADPNTVYVSVNLAISDASYQGVGTVTADSKTDLYSVNPAYLATNADPFPARGAKKQRGFFVFGDGSKDAEFTSPEAIYVALTTPGDMNGDGAATCADLALTKTGIGARSNEARFLPRVDMDDNGVIDVRDIAAMARLVPAGPVCN